MLNEILEQKGTVYRNEDGSIITVIAEGGEAPAGFTEVKRSVIEAEQKAEQKVGQKAAEEARNKKTEARKALAKKLGVTVEELEAAL